MTDAPDPLAPSPKSQVRVRAPPPGSLAVAEKTTMVTPAMATPSGLVEKLATGDAWNGVPPPHASHTLPLISNRIVALTTPVGTLR